MCVRRQSRGWAGGGVAGREGTRLGCTWPHQPPCELPRRPRVHTAVESNNAYLEDGSQLGRNNDQQDRRRPRKEAAQGAALPAAPLCTVPCARCFRSATRSVAIGLGGLGCNFNACCGLRGFAGRGPVCRSGGTGIIAAVPVGVGAAAPRPAGGGGARLWGRASRRRLPLTADGGGAAGARRGRASHHRCRGSSRGAAAVVPGARSLPASSGWRRGRRLSAMWVGGFPFARGHPGACRWGPAAWAG